MTSSYADGFVPLPERKPKPRQHTKHELHAISFCGTCNAPILFGCSFRTKSRHELRSIRTFCTYTEVRKHWCVW